MERSSGDVPIITAFIDIFDEVLRLPPYREIECFYRALARDNTYT